MEAKYKVGDIVRIKNREWYDLYKNSDDDVVNTIIPFDRSQAKYCGKEAKIIGACVVEYMKDKRMVAYYLNIDNGKDRWAAEMFDENYLSEISLQNQRWTDLTDKEKENIKHIYNDHPEWEDVINALENEFGKHNLQPERGIKTWKDIEENNLIDETLEEQLGALSYWNGKTKAICDKCSAALKIAKLIELGYGGMITDEEWNQVEDVPCVLWDNATNTWTIRYSRNREFISFRSTSQAEEFMSYVENQRLIEQYYMV